MPTPTLSSSRKCAGSTRRPKTDRKVTLPPGGGEHEAPALRSRVRRHVRAWRLGSRERLRRGRYDGGGRAALALAHSGPEEPGEPPLRFRRTIQLALHPAGSQGSAVQGDDSRPAPARGLAPHHGAEPPRHEKSARHHVPPPDSLRAGAASHPRPP